jgi:CubicO group peptidase (beta-lactamase class C family)
LSEAYADYFSEVGDQVRALMAEANVPGAAVGLYCQGWTAAAGFGITSVEHPLLVTADTLFQVGSITKTFTATMTMRLVEKGLLELDIPIRKYLPDFRVADPTAGRQVTVRHLLTHTADWAGDVFEDTGEGDDALARYAAFLAEVEQLAPLGTTFSYNNAGFYLLGHLLEVVTGESYPVLLAEMILEPLGMRQAYLQPAEVMTRRFAVGHSYDEEKGVRVARPWALPRAVYPVGGLVTTVEELLRYGRFHLGDGLTADGQRLLHPSSLEQMQTVQITIGGATEALGLSWHIQHLDGVKLLYHGGGTKGQISRLLLVPEHDLVLAVATNGEQGGRITRGVSRQVLERFLDLVESDPVPSDDPAGMLAGYAGRYTRPYQDVDLWLGDDERLRIKFTPKAGFPSRDVPPGPPTEPAACALYDADRLIVLEGKNKDALGEFIRRADNSIGWLRIGGRIHQREG